MKYLMLIALLFGATMATNAQADTDGALHETAKAFMRSGDYDNAILVLNRAIAKDPGNLDMQKDLLFASYLKRDFAKAKEVGENLVKRSDADVQMFHMLGLTYKAIADYKEAERLYKTGIKKYPAEGVLYSEYGEMLAEKNPEDAMKLFEKGLEADVNHSANYYHVAKKYAQNGEILWSILYSEIFLNLESFTGRSAEIKNILLNQYKQFYLQGSSTTPASKNRNEFASAVSEVLSAQQSQAAFGITPETLTAIRTRFVLDWFNKYAEKFPFRLFEHQRQLLQEGLFDSYNQWLFGPAANLAAYQLWQKYHTQEYDNYMAFVRGRVFKIPSGQQYKTWN